VQTWPVQMKKGRSGFRVEAIAPEELADQVTAAFFRHSTTAGVRRWAAERSTLPRRQVTVQLAPDVSVRVKVLEQPDGRAGAGAGVKALEGGGGGSVRVKPEYDDVLAAAQALGRPPLEIARAAERGAETLIARSKESG
jgi:pyridinium-3,5-bisthiocarboxylic acid mononucleotide nickel chelatase